MRLYTLPLLFLTAQAALTFKGVDWSSLLIEEASGQTYKNTKGTVQPLETILKASGVNTVRQRLWVNPSDGNYGLEYNLKLAKRAKAAGLNVFLDFHYSDSWADPSKQVTPTAWAQYSIGDLSYKVYNYTLATMNSFQSAGIPLSLVSIGNEITSGMLFPIGQLSKSGGAYNLARLLHSASAGIKDSTLSTKPKILIHLDNGWNYDTQKSWYDNVLSQGPLTASDFDIQAVSYYPFYNSAATLASLKSSLTQMKAKYGKEVQVVETNWPTKCSSPAYAFPSDTKSIPFSAAGQTTWLKDVASAVTASGGNGLFYWEPAWLSNAGLGSSCESNVMVDGNGVVMSSMATFGSL